MTNAPSRPRWFLFAGLFVAAVVGAVIAGVLIVSITARQQEARNPTVRPVELTDMTVDPAVWGKNFPFEYAGYKKTVDMVRTKFGGSEAMPRKPSDTDPRAVVATSKIEEDPRLRTMWAGYAFAADFREDRGHAYMLDDQTYTDRQKVVKQPGTCMQCHASAYAAMMKMGEGDLYKGFDRLNAMPYMEARKLVEHPVTCLDCHEPKTMELRITRPAFLDGIKALKAAQGVANYDVSHASRQEMRTFVCAQCHVEYYFKGAEKRLVFPWSTGQSVDSIMALYDEAGFKDWVHKETGAGMLKAQHPEFEMWSQGIHARSGVACADCHMPYTKMGAMKVSDHHVRSPLLNVNRSCQGCHKVSEAELKNRVESIQAKLFALRNEAMEALMALVADLKAAKDAGRPDAELESARYLQRRATFYLDFVEAENSVGFHAPQEATRILGEAINFARQGQVALRDPKFKPTVKIVAIDTRPPAPATTSATPPTVAAAAVSTGAVKK